MTKQVSVSFVDNRDGSPADVTRSMTFEGVRYSWDLSDDNDAKLQKALKPWLDCADKRATRGRASTNGQSSDNGDVRAWAIENGFDVSSRGRISAEVQAAYAEANA